MTFADVKPELDTASSKDLLTAEDTTPSDEPSVVTFIPLNKITNNFFGEMDVASTSDKTKHVIREMAHSTKKYFIRPEESGSALPCMCKNISNIQKKSKN